MAMHFWDKFLDTNSFWATDTTLLLGVPKVKVEEQVGIFSSLLEMDQVPFGTGVRAMEKTARLLEPWASRDSLFDERFIHYLDKYFYDPQSPVRDEDLWGAFAGVLARSSREDAGRYGYIAARASLARRGTIAPDFVYSEASGRRRTLHGIKAEYLVLIFGNPDCSACKDLMVAMREDSRISGLIAQGRLKVADIYIDEDVALWKSRLAEYPREWIHGYDPLHIIRDDFMYHVRAIPSIYLLDKDKRVLLKDAPEDRLLKKLAGL